MCLPANFSRPTRGVLFAGTDASVHWIPASGLVMGRGSDCHVVLAGRDVSRRHAVIVPDGEGFLLSDESMNGVFVNGERASRSQRLHEGDVLRIGDETFRFSASYEATRPAGGGSATIASTAPDEYATDVPDGSTATAPMRRRSAHDAAASHMLYATLEVLGGRIPAGLQFRIERPLAQLGRGAACDVCLVDDSVSGAHATLIVRGARWHLIDHASRNGTYVDGQRVEHCTLPGACELRLGNVTLRFEPGPASD